MTSLVKSPQFETDEGAASYRRGFNQCKMYL